MALNHTFDIHRGGTDMFWGEIPPCDHMVQIYDADQVFLDTLEGFLAGGLRAGEGVIVIATPQHLTSLEARLRARGPDMANALSTDQYVALEAEKVLDEFMINGWPDDVAFSRFVLRLLTRARGAAGRNVRAFGEMVAVLWARGDQGATVQLEHLWHDLCRAEGFSLFCAYPRAGFTADAAASLDALCEIHSRVIPGRAELNSA